MLRSIGSSGFVTLFEAQDAIIGSGSTDRAGTLMLPFSAPGPTKLRFQGRSPYAFTVALDSLATRVPSATPTPSATPAPWGEVEERLQPPLAARCRLLALVVRECQKSLDLSRGVTIIRPRKYFAKQSIFCRVSIAESDSPPPRAAM